MQKNNQEIKEWFLQKEKFARQLFDEWSEKRKPILVIVEENTANVFCCVLRDELDKLIRIYARPADIYLVHSFENHLIDYFKQQSFNVYQEISLIESDPSPSQ